MPAQSKSKNRKKKRPSDDARRARRTAYEVERAGARITPADNPYAPVYWRPQNAGAEVDLHVPSGQVCLVKTVGLQGLVKAGVLNHMDSLTSLVSDKFIIDTEAGPELDANKVASDETVIKDVYDVVNRTVCHVVLQPHIEMTPRIDEEGEEVSPDSPLYKDATPVGPRHPLRKDGVVYIDTVPEEDQMFIFQYITGGTADLERFHSFTEELLAGMDDEQAVGVPSE